MVFFVDAYLCALEFREHLRSRGGRERHNIADHLAEAARLERELETAERRENLRSADPRKPDLGRQGAHERAALASQADEHRKQAADAADRLKRRLERQTAETQEELKETGRSASREDIWEMKDRIRSNREEIKTLTAMFG